MKALLLADLHLHHLPTWRLEWCEKFIDHILHEYGGGKLHVETDSSSGARSLLNPSKHGLDLYILGDVLEIRDKVDSRVLNLLIKLVKGWRLGDVVWLSGQHDSYVPGKATLYELHDLNLDNGRVIVVDNEVFKHHENWFVPYQRRDEDYRECLAKVPDDVILFTHMPVKEIIEMLGGKNVEGISVKEFSRFKLAISGDIHKFYDFPDLKYVGAPSQRDWRDKGVDGRIGILEDGKFDRVATTHPKHIEVGSAEEVPATGQYIIKTKRGLNIQAANIIATVETSAIDIESVELQVSGSTSDQLSAYMKANKPPVTIAEAKKYADELLALRA